MKYEKSCGFVVYKEVQGSNYYLIIRSKNGEYGFPKGHIENNETELETAIRELKEETNLEVELIDGFRWQIEYNLPNKQDIMKQSVYFLGKCITNNIVCQESEVCEAIFVPLSKAIEMLSFDETKKMLLAADKFLNSNPKTEHIMNLHSSPFNMIREGKKTIELRLFDEI